MDTSNPITSLRLMLADGLKAFQPLMDAIGGEHNFQVWDLPIDIRGDLSESETGPRRIQMAPDGGRWAFSQASGAVDFERRFAFEIYSNDTTDAASPEYVEWLLIVAMAYFWEGLYPAQGGIPIEVPEPLIIDSIGVVEAKQDRNPFVADTENWTGVCDIVVAGRVDRQRLKDWVNP